MNIKKTLKVTGYGMIAAGFAFLLAGCDPADVTAAQAQAATVEACNFVPTAATIAGDISAIPASATASATDIAKAICAAVTASVNTTSLKAARLKVGVPSSFKVVIPGSTKSIVVTGYFVK